MLSLVMESEVVGALEDELLEEAADSDESAEPPQAARPRGSERAMAAMALRRMKVI
jgi:hypothetical protein